jgi:glycosyltransferase involved in cell wall biosynthesis
LKIAYFILNSFDFDSRARLEVATLTDMGNQVEIIATVGANSKSYLGCPIHRLPQWRHPTRKFRFVQFNLLAALSGLKTKADIYHAVDLDTLQAANWASKRNKGRVVYEARELYTELEALSGRKRVRDIWERLERKLILRADKVITINNSIADELCSRYGIARPTIIRNVAPLSKKFEPIDLRKFCGIPYEWKVIIYQGVMRNGQGLFYLIDIMRQLEKVALVFVGNGPLENDLKAQAAKNGLSGKIKFIGRVNPDELHNYTAGADAGILLMEDIALNNKLALPQKLFQYLAAGIPQIVSPMPELSAFVNSEGTGIVIPLGSVSEAAVKVSTFLRDDNRLKEIKASCRLSAQKHNWDKESEKLREVYRSLEKAR